MYQSEAHLKKQSAVRNFLTWSDCQSKTDVCEDGPPPGEFSARWCQYHPACPEPSSCRNTSGTQSLPHWCVPCGHLHRSPLLPDAWSPGGREEDEVPIIDFIPSTSTIHFPFIWRFPSYFQIFTLRSCQLQRLDKFSTTRRYSVRTGGPYLSLPERLRLL